MKRKETVYVAYVRYKEDVEDHACSAKSEKEAIKTICSLLYCTKEQIVKLEKYNGYRR